MARSFGATLASPARSLLASYLARRDPSCEDIQRLLRVVVGACQDVEQHELSCRERVRRHVAVVEQEQCAHRVARMLAHDGSADGCESSGASAGYQQPADQRRVAELRGQSTDE